MAAGLITTEKIGREKHHYLNPVPIRRVHDRWVSKYAAPFAAALAQLKHTLEGPMQGETVQQYEVYIQGRREHTGEGVPPVAGHDEMKAGPAS